MNRSVKSFLRNGYQRLSDRFCKPGVVFHHLPKCGGSSLSWALRSSYFINHTNINTHARRKAGELRALHHNLNQHDQANIANETILLYLLSNNYACITGHIHASEIALLEYSNSHKFISLVRNPIERLFSNFVWRVRVQRLTDAKDFLEFLDSEESYAIRNIYLSYFSGYDPRSTTKERALDQARRNIDRFHHIGHLEEINQTQRDLSELLDRKINIGRRNVTPSHLNKDKSDVFVHRDKIEEVCRSELSIYKHIVERFPLQN